MPQHTDLGMPSLPGDAAPPATGPVAGGALSSPPVGAVDPDRGRARLLEALALELDAIPTTRGALARLLEATVALVGAEGAWLALPLDDAEALVAVATHGRLPLADGDRLPRDRAFAARALHAAAAVYADPATGVRWPDTLLDDRPARAVAAPVRTDTRDLGALAVIGGPGRLFTVADGGVVVDLAALAARRLDRGDLETADPLDPPARPREHDATLEVALDADPEPDVGPDEAQRDVPAARIPLLLAAVAATDADAFAREVVDLFADPALLGLGLALVDEEGAIRYPAATGALATLRGTRAILDDGARAPQVRHRRSIAVADARQLVPTGWRVLVPALPAIDALFDADRPVPQHAIERIAQHASIIARCFAALTRRNADSGNYLGAAALRAMRASIVARLHDVTSPIAGIAALTELLVDEPLPDDSKELVLLVRQSVARAIQAAGALRRLTDDPTILERNATDVAEVIRAVLAERSDAHRALAIEVVSTLDPALPQIPYPPSVLRDWLSVAFAEAERALFGAVRRRIELRAAVEELGLVIVVADDGSTPSAATTVRDLQGATVTRERTDDGWTVRRLHIPLRLGIQPTALPPAP
ncbi:MAG: hypothetical protein MUF40_05760 [Gemmatimonadaceae bacterium]|nr:hypothetical protein [Gemmatimonadaceae bacterium]